jgi:hypothetical protein
MKEIPVSDKPTSTGLHGFIEELNKGTLLDNWLALSKTGRFLIKKVF